MSDLRGLEGGGLPGDAPLIGRDAEFEEIMSAFRASASAAVLIAGRAGVGKSRLAAEVMSAMMATGRTAARVIATESAAAVPFGPFVALLPDVATLAGDQLQLLQNATRAIADRAHGEHPLLLVVDDAHLLDARSAALVHQLVQNRSCGLVATVRTPEVAPDPITSLWKEELALRINVEPLMREETDSLVAALLGGPVAGSARRWLWAVTGGNPLFVRELLLGAAESQSVYAQDGIWFLRLPLPAPARLTDLIAARLSGLAPNTMEAVELLALGEPLGFDELVRGVGREPVEDAERHGLLVMRDNADRSEVCLSHPIYSEVVRARIPAVRLRRLALKLAEAVEATPARRAGDVLRIARWRLDAGVLGKPDVLEQAARTARAVHDLQLAARFARAAVSAGGGVTAGLILGQAEYTAGRHAEAESTLAGLVAHCHTDEERAMIASARAHNLGVLMGNQAGATAVLDEALSTIEEPGLRRHLLVRQMTNDVWCGQLSDAARSADELLASGDDVAMLRGSHVCSLALALLGRTERAVAIAYRARDLQQRSLVELGPGEVPPEWRPAEGLLMGAVIAHIVGGRLAAADADTRTALEMGLSLGDREFQATFCLLRGWVLVERGLLAQAARSFHEGAAISREISDTPGLRWCVAGVALATAMRGDATAAAAAEAELVTLPAQGVVVLDPHLVERCHGWVLAASGQLTAARAHMLEAARSARAGEQYGAESVLLHDLVRLGDAKSAGPRLRDLTGVIDGDFVPAFAAHAAARESGDPSAIEAAVRQFAELGALLLAAEAANEAAVTYGAAGRERQASAMTRECARFRALCGVERSPLLVNAHTAEELTPREREIAMLTASGMSSKAVAERLFLSVRTVDNHLLHIYSKLGINTRAALQTAMQGVGA